MAVVVPRSASQLFAEPEPCVCPRAHDLVLVAGGFPELEEKDPFYFGAGGFWCSRCSIHSRNLSKAGGAPSPVWVCRECEYYACCTCASECRAGQDQDRKLTLVRSSFFQEYLPAEAPPPENLVKLKRATEKILKKPVKPAWHPPIERKQSMDPALSRQMSKRGSKDLGMAGLFRRSVSKSMESGALAALARKSSKESQGVGAKSSKEMPGSKKTSKEPPKSSKEPPAN